MSHKLNASDERIGAMHYNDVMNIKARHETLIGASTNERIVVDSVRKETLESMLMKVQDRNDKLFIAVGQGVGKFKNNNKP